MAKEHSFLNLPKEISLGPGCLVPQSGRGKLAGPEGSAWFFQGGAVDGATRPKDFSVSLFSSQRRSRVLLTACEKLDPEKPVPG